MSWGNCIFPDTIIQYSKIEFSALSYVVAPKHMCPLSTWYMAYAYATQELNVSFCLILLNLNLNSHMWQGATALHNTGLHGFLFSLPCWSRELLLILQNSTQMPLPPECPSCSPCGRCTDFENIHVSHSTTIILWYVDSPTRWESLEGRESVWLISKSLVECLARENYLTNICWMFKWDSETIFRCEQI